jgi:hypothetical protein
MTLLKNTFSFDCQNEQKCTYLLNFFWKQSREWPPDVPLMGDSNVPVSVLFSQIKDWLRVNKNKEIKFSSCCAQVTATWPSPQSVRCLSARRLRGRVIRRRRTMPDAVRQTAPASLRTFHGHRPTPLYIRAVAIQILPWQTECSTMNRRLFMKSW